ncbi:hypothetical protein U1Q18_036607 [Sarracenia purpurea var. burkii]
MKVIFGVCDEDHDGGLGVRGTFGRLQWYCWSRVGFRVGCDGHHDDWELLWVWKSTKEAKEVIDTISADDADNGERFSCTEI